MGNFISKFVKDFTGQTAAEKANAAQQKAIKENQARLQPLYDMTLPGAESYYAASAGQVDPRTGRPWSPANNPAFQWQQEQLNKQMGRSLRALGRSNSTFGMNTLADANRDLIASEYDRGYNRLGNAEAAFRGYLTGTNANTTASGNSTADMELAKGAIKNQLFMAGLKGLSMAAGGAIGGPGGAAAAGNAMGNFSDNTSLFTRKPQWTPWEEK